MHALPPLVVQLARLLPPPARPPSAPCFLIFSGRLLTYSVWLGGMSMAAAAASPAAVR